MKLAKQQTNCYRALGTRQHPAVRPAAVAVQRRRTLQVCQTAASDEKSRAEPLYLSDLIAFETDVDADGNPSPASSGSMSGAPRDASNSGSSLASSLGLGNSSSGGGEDDHTHKAQEIIHRATEVLAAARAALSTPPAEPGTSSGAANGTAGASAAAGAAVPQHFSSSNAPRAAAGSKQQSTPPARSGAAAPTASAAGPGPSSSSSSSSAPASDGSSASSSEPLTRRWSQLSDGQDLTRHVLQSALDQMQSSGAPIAAPKDPSAPPSSSSSSSSRGGNGGGEGGGTAMPTSQLQTKGPSGPPTMGGAAAASTASGGARLNRDIRSSGRAPGDTGHSPAPSWAQSLLGSDDFGGSSGSSLFPYEPQLQRAPARPAAAPAGLAFAEAPTGLSLPPVGLGLQSQSQLDAAKASAAVLPPLQSVLELTTAFRPPERTGAAPAADVIVDAVTGEETAAPAPVGRALADGSGMLADGTWWEKKSGIEYGKNGYWKRWQLLRGGSADGAVEWEETWWDASDYTGMKEMGAQKQGRNAGGDAWRESWTERLMYASNDLDCVVERNAHKWAAQGDGDEWEEKWGEHYHASGKVAKFADKWGKTGPNVWHERWGEDYDSGGDACVKWTDKWAERLLPDNAREQWGDKWHEAFANGRGEKNGEVWSVGAGGDRYQRWWGEQHMGDMRVRRHGHSTTGEQWDDIAHMDTYYNPVPHFGFKLALDHSPQLRNVPLKPKEIKPDDPFGPGLDQL